MSNILLDCALVALPLHSAAVIAEIGDALKRLLGDVVSHESPSLETLVLQVYDRLHSGALMNRF